MDELYLEVNDDPTEAAWVSVPLETAVVFFVLNYVGAGKYVTINLVKSAKKCGEQALSIKLCGVNWQMSSVAPALCSLPLIVTNEAKIHAAGLCTVLRQLVKCTPPEDSFHGLLGFRQGCLMASAESSLWTRFCEVDIISSVKCLMNSSPDKGIIPIPKDLARFEVHMSQPVRIHNVKKMCQQSLEQTNAVREHHYAEGPDVTLADVILFPCIHIIFQSIKSVYLKQHIPLTTQWYERMLRQQNLEDAVSVIDEVSSKVADNLYVKYVFPSVAKHSLYKSDPKRYKPRSRIFTNQGDVEESLRIVSDLGVVPQWASRPFGSDMPFDWECLPYAAQPEGGNLPASRLQRKGQQLENLAKAVLKVAQPGNVIVDFCSGVGHLGIVLAYLLPRCRIVLLENKEESLNRARERVSVLGLTNVDLCLSNLDYFQGSFDVGVSLHACGVATDLVIRQCIANRAIFVCCPCCYGSVQNNHVVTYPRSKLFRESALSLRDYLVLSHSADQTHGNENAKTIQGKACMGIIDTDRYLQAKESGYRVFLSKLYPETCTPKNNMIVGIPQELKSCV